MKKIVVLLFCVCTSLVLFSQVKKDSLWALWSDTSLSSEIRLKAIGSLYNDGDGMYNPDNDDTAFYHARLLYDFAKENNSKKWMSEGQLNQGNYYFKKGDLKAREYYIEAIKLAEEVDAKKSIAGASYNLGLTYLKQGDFVNGFPAFTKAAKNFEAIGSKMLQSKSYDKIGMMYGQQQDSKSIDYLNKAIVIREELIKTDSNLRDKMVLAMMKQSVTFMQKQIDLLASQKAGLKEVSKDELTEDSKKQADEISEIIDDLGLDSNSALALLNEGKKALEKGNKAKAKEYFAKGIKASEAEGNNLTTSSYLSMAASSFQNVNDSVSAIPYLKRGLEYAQMENEFTTIGQFSFILYETYKGIGNYKKSLEMFQLSLSMRDSILNIENAKAVIEQQVQSDYEKKRIIDDLENEKLIAIEIQKKENQQKLSIAIGIGLLLISILAILIFNRLKVTKKQKAIIEEQKKKVEQSEKYKEQFLANMSHEIRTPMHAISGMVKILERKKHYPAQENFLKAMRTSSDNLIVILNDVLDISKIEAGKLDIESIPIKPAAIIENVMQIMKFKAEEKGLLMSSKIEENVPAILMGDPTRLNQILINLVGNSIKFTEKGKVEIGLCVVGDRMKFGISDTGIGIPKNRIDKIFGAFEQAKDSTSRNYGGTGLGLSISQQLTELQNGKIWVESAEGKGSTFYVELPLVTAAADATGQDLITEDHLKSMAESLSGARILLVEDNAFNQMIAQDDLNYYIKDVAIDTVENGKLAVEHYTANSYDLILMDVQMPIMNGFEASQKIRELEKEIGNGKRIPIIAMTASLLKTEIDSCLSAGMDNYIPKPYQSEELIGPIYTELIENRK